MQQAKARIVVLDDHSLIIDGIYSMCAGHPHYVVAGGFSSSAALNEYIHANSAPEFLLLDINLNGEDGMQLCKSYSKSHPDMKVIMLTGLSEPAIIKSAVKSGCAGFMLKNMKADELWDCLARVQQGELHLHPDVERIMMSNAIAGKADTNSFIPRLSRREQEVLELIVQERTTQEIAEALFISVNTVETHRASLLTKTGARNIAGLVRIAIEKGLV